MIVKIGGSVWTFKKERKIEIRKDILKALGPLLERDVVVLGAGSVGHILYEYYKKGLITWAELHTQAQGFFLNAVQLLGKHFFPIHPCSIMISPSLEKEKLAQIVKYTRNFATPCVHADLIGDYVLSGDDIALFLGKSFKEPVVFLVDVDGVLVDGQVAKVIRGEEIPNLVSKMKATDVTGGMKGKLEKIYKYGMSCWIINGLHPQRLKELKEGGETLGTYIKV